jgi:hypothetical protein
MVVILENKEALMRAYEGDRKIITPVAICKYRQESK